METEKVQEVPKEKVFLLGYEEGNGYHCGCCRQTWFKTEEFDSVEQVLAYLKKAKQEKTDIEPQWLREVSPETTELHGDVDYAIKLLGINHG